MRTKLIEERKPTTKERKENGAERVFIREDENGRQYTIYACRCYESWEQWGTSTRILGDNVNDVENWRNKGIK